MAATTGLPPFVYPAASPNARPVNGHPYLWSRNLLANRLYDCPVIFMEPYVMNSTIDLPRLHAGDYEGIREINGVPRQSIFREYADALAEGLRKIVKATRRRTGGKPASLHHDPPQPAATSQHPGIHQPTSQAASS